ncbi:MAG TPA: helix-turn-helix domain-containing protein, partial [Candidatus Thermoplasmatota archaeon]|nr:helix-turn-helix domain-containing protein [Candidatus Thermoplasmatota archaeon]
PFPDPSSRFTPLTRDGPEDGGAGLPYKLEDALASLRGDATLLDFQTWRRAHPDAYVQYAWVGLAEGMQGDVAEWHVELAVPVSETDADVYMLASRQEQMPTGLFGYAADRVTNSDDGHGIGTYGQRAPATGEQAMDFRTAIALWLARAPEPYASMPVSEVGYLAPTLDGPAAIYALSGSSRASLVDGVRSDRAGLLLDAATGAALQSVRRGTDIRYGAITVNPDPLDSLTAHQDQRTFLAGTPVEPPLLIGAALTAAALLALLAHGGFLAVMYSRLRSSNLLATPVRRRIYDLVDQHPGIHFQGVAGAIGIGIGATMYHLSVLRRGGLITRVDLRGYSRYYLSGSVPPRALQRVAELEAGSARAVYEAVRARPGITLGEVARQVNVSPPAAHKTVERLQQAGLVEKKVEGRRVRLTAREVGMEN